MKKGIIVLLSLFLVCAVAGLVRAQSENSKDWDILGVKIGMSLDDAISAVKSNVQDVHVVPKKGSFSQGSFRSPEFTLGADCIKPDGTRESVKLICDFAPPNTVVAITRKHEEFSNTPDRPSAEVVYKGLVDKYGKPDVVDDTGNGNRYVWFKNADPKLGNSKFMTNNSNSNGVRPLQFVVGDVLDIDYGTQPMGFINVLKDLRVDSKEGIGTCVVCETFLWPSDKLLTNIRCGLVDSVRLKNSYKYLADLMREGESGTAAKTKAQGDQSKPPKF